MRWDRPSRTAEIGFILADAFRNRGLMTEACRAVIAFGFEKMGLETIEARSFPHNAASIRVFEKLGMKQQKQVKAHISLNGEWVDLVCYRIGKGDRFEK